MNRRNQKIVIAIFITGIIIFLMNILIDNPYTHRLVRVAINESVNTHTNLNIDFKAVKVSVVPPGVSLYGVHVAPSENLDNPILTASHAKARLSLWALFLGELRLAKLEFGDMTFIWPPPWNFPGFLKTDPNAKVVDTPTEITWPPSFDLPIDTIAVKSSKIYIEIPTVNKVPLKKEVFAFSAVGIDAEFNYTTWLDSSISLEVANINASLGAVSMIEDTALESSIELAGQKINANFLKIKGERLNFDGKLFADLNLIGKSGILDSIKITGGGKAISDFSLLGSYLDIKETFGVVTGEVVLNTEIPIESTKELKFSLSGSGAVQNGYIDGFRLHNSFGKFEVTPDKLDLTDINIVIGDQTFGKANGYIMFNDPLDIKFTAAPSGLRLVDLLDALTVDFGVIDSAIHAQDLVLEGQGFPFFLNIKASAQFSDILLPETPYDQSRFPVSPACRFDFKMYVDANHLDFAGTAGECFQMDSVKFTPPAARITTAPPTALGVSPVSFDGKIHFEEEKGLDLVVKSPNVNLILSEYFAQIPMAGTGQIETRIYGPFSNVLIKNKATIDNALINRMPFGLVKGEATVDRLMVYWDNIEISLPTGGVVNAKKGSLDIEKNLIFDSDFSLLNVSEESIKNIFQPYLESEPGKGIQFGIESATGRLSGPIMHPLAWIGDANIGLRNLQVDEEKFFDSITAVYSADKNSMQISNALYLLGDFATRLSAKITRKEAFKVADAETSDDILVFLGLNPTDIFQINVASVNSGEKDIAQEKADHLSLIPYAGTYLKSAAITGQIELKGKVEGPLSNLQPCSPFPNWK